MQLLGGLADGLECALRLGVAALVRVDQQAQPHVALLHVSAPRVRLQPHDCICVPFLRGTQHPAEDYPESLRVIADTHESVAMCDT